MYKAAIKNVDQNLLNLNFNYRKTKTVWEYMPELSLEDLFLVSVQ